MNIQSYPLFTVITVCRNSEKTIRKTIESVLNQTYDNYEYWIIDGGSSDGTVEIIKSYEIDFRGRLFYVSEPDSVIYNAMNKGIIRAKGDVVGIVNSDDWLEADALAIVSDAFRKNINPRDKIYCGWMNFYSENGGKVILKTSKERHDKCLKKYKMGVRHPATFVGNNVYKQAGAFEEKYRIIADLDFITRCANSGVSFVFIPHVLTNMSDGGVSNNRKYKKTLLQDFKLFYSVNITNKTKVYFMYLRSVISEGIKEIIPKRLVRLYRILRDRSI